MMGRIGVILFKLEVFFVIFLIPIMIFSCATGARVEKQPSGPTSSGVWHRVNEGQTLWRIAKTYRVSLEEIKEVNEIQDVFHIPVGTWIFIPKASRPLFVQGKDENPIADSTDVGFVWPVRGEVVRAFGKFENDFNYGIDIKTGSNEDVVASHEGVVVMAGTVRGYGTTIIIEHGNDFFSLYSKNLKSLVREGQVVKKNNVIAKTLSPGENTAEILHYELFYRGKPVNPLFYLP
jgi:LysM repeat protein